MTMPDIQEQQLSGNEVSAAEASDDARSSFMDEYLSELKGNQPDGQSPSLTDHRAETEDGVEFELDEGTKITVRDNGLIVVENKESFVTRTLSQAGLGFQVGNNFKPIHPEQAIQTTPEGFTNVLTYGDGTVIGTMPGGNTYVKLPDGIAFTATVGENRAATTLTMGLRMP
jgi:hypothetical protein